MSIASFKHFTAYGNEDRSRHFAWSPGEVETELRSDEKKIESDETPETLDPKKGKFGWGMQDPSFRRRVDEEASPSGFVDVKANEPISREELDHHAEHRKTYDSHMRNAHVLYKNHSYEINKKLRDSHRHGDDGILIPDASNKVANHLAPSEHKIEHFHALDRITSLPTKTDMHVYRGFSEFPIHDLHAGAEFTDHGYVSTTSRINRAGGFSHLRGGTEPAETLTRIRIPAGTRAHILDHPNVEGPKGVRHESEKETLLGRGTRFRVTGHSRLSGEEAKHLTGEKGFRTLPMHIVHMEVVGQNPKPLVADRNPDNADFYFVRT